MKKIKFVFLLLLLTLCFTVISCKDKGSNNEGNEQTEHTHNYVDGVCSCGDTIEVKYTVQFVDFDGTVLKTEEVVKGSSATAPSNPSRDGYSFAGWDKIYTTVNSDLVVNAVYIANPAKHIVTFNADNGTAITTVEVLHGEKIVKPADPVKEGYVFLGWYNGSTQFDFDSFVTANIEVVAKWELVAKAYYVTVDQQLDVPSTYQIEVVEGTCLEKPQDPVKEGYTFVGWYVDGALYDFTTPVTGDFTLTAEWEVTKYTITLKPNGGKIEGNIKKIEFTNYEDVVLPTISRDNFVFIGWYENNALCEGITENRDYTLTAKWDGALFNITYELNGGNFDTEVSATYKYGVSFTLPIPVRENFTFAGWYKSSDFSGSEVTKFGTSQKGDITVYAKWERYVTYELNGGNWTYRTREAMVEDFLTDALAWAGKTNRPDGMVQGEGDTRVGFANVFTGCNIQNFFTSSYSTKWGWVRQYIIDVTTNTSSKSSLQSNSEPFWRYAVGAFLFEEYRSNYPISEDFTKDAAANGFWDYLSRGTEKTFVVEEDGSFKVPVRIYYVFDGWYENPDFSGEKVEKVIKDCTLYAKWIEEVPVSSIAITNKVDKMDRYVSYQLTWELNPNDAAIKSVEFTSSNTSIAIVSDKGLVTPLADGVVTITIKSLSPSAVTDSFVVTVSSPSHFDISYDTESYVTVGNDIQLLAEYIKRDKSTSSIIWSSLNSDIATVSETGVVVGVKKGVATIRATADDGNYVDMVVTVLNESELAELKFVLESHNSNVFTRYDLGIGAGVPVFYDDIIGGVSKYLFEDYVVHYDHYLEDPYCAYDNVMKVEFITVHYAADMTGSATHGGENLATFNVSKNTTARDASWHFGVGNDGIWACQNELYGAWHAGSSKTMTWTDTGIKHKDTDPKYAKITLEADGYFYLNGINTNIKNSTTSTRLNQMGLAYRVNANGNYELGGHYYNSTYNFISSTGGNQNSIGMETSCAQGSDQWLTWQYTAQLVAHLLVKYNLPIQRVVGHHFFSGKDCPQQLLENDMEIWWEFMDMVEAEHKMLTTYKDLSLSMNVVNGAGILDSNGRITSQPTYSEVVTYEVVLSTGQVVTLATQVPGIYNK